MAAGYDSSENIRRISLLEFEPGSLGSGSVYVQDCRTKDGRRVCVSRRDATGRDKLITLIREVKMEA